MDFSRDYTVHYYEADTSRRLTLPALVQYFEDIAILHSARCGFDLDYFDANHCGWMLLKWDITVHALPLFGESVTVGTTVHAMKRFLADRVFVMTAKDGSVLAEGRSNWLFVDMDKRRPIRIADGQYECFGVTRESEKDFVSIEDVPSVPESDRGEGDFFHAPIHIVNSDIDTNRHVNNVRYINWALDSLPPDFPSELSPSRLTVQYLKEMGAGGAGEVVSVIEHARGTIAGDDGLPETRQISRHTIRSGGEECCSLEILWEK